MITMTHKQIRETLTKAGVQASSPRMAIASFVWNTDSHPTAEEVKTEVEKTFPTVSLATVYNTLRLFVDKGLLREIQDSSTRSIRYDCNMEPHYHFVDEVTGRMYDLMPDLLKMKPDLSRLDSEFKVREIDVTLRGRRIQTKNISNEKRRT